MRARKTKAFFDPDANDFCARQGFVDISPAADGGVLKKVLREGKESRRWIEEGCPTFGAFMCVRVRLAW